MKKVGTAVLVSVFCLMITVAYAGEACIYGTAVYADGSKVDGTATVSTSWNGVKAFPKNGEYRLCLGSNPEKTITIYLDGDRYTTLYVDGDTRLDIIKR
ncbi:MAG: hypothetical protein AB7S75_21640 [Desulfococcaceae bacterium]